MGWLVVNAFNRKLDTTAGFFLSVTPVPEPDSFVMLLAGLGLIGISRRNAS